MSSYPPALPDPGGFGPAAARALDRFDVPEPSAGFFDRLSMIPASPQPLLWRPNRLRFRPTSRGPWMRRTTIGLVAMGLASATAAAAGAFDRFPFDIPVIAKLFVPAAPSDRVAVKLAVTPRARLRAATLAPLETASAPITTPTPTPFSAARAQRLARFQALPMPVRAMATERLVTRIKRRLARRGVDVPRAAIRARVIAETGQSDLPIGPRWALRAQYRAALIAAPPGSLPPRLERLRARIRWAEARQPGEGAHPGGPSFPDSSAPPSGPTAASPPAVQSATPTAEPEMTDRSRAVEAAPSTELAANH